ncbi:hypothetical protein Psefu_2178 [Pseudomonas fulva 12-X]|uniref:Uncharacterized protein n=1 Tax=Pseudomonas fulva (strain 12-X) TaxID=743720 RepID=F6AAU4_PSEF1|nr:hypothetical protein Psefu_2178 [Pseudomonas fulva 12-X]
MVSLIQPKSLIFNLEVALGRFGQIFVVRVSCITFKFIVPALFTCSSSSSGAFGGGR